MTDAAPTVRLNGDVRDWPREMSVADLLTTLGIDTRVVAVERNRVVVKRAHFGQTVIHAGDEVEIVNFVGGG
jgi:sulfur carrier protein